MKAQKWILAKHFDGFPKDSDLQLVEEEIEEDLKDGGEFLMVMIMHIMYIEIFITKWVIS